MKEHEEISELQADVEDACEKSGAKHISQEMLDELWESDSILLQNLRGEVFLDIKPTPEEFSKEMLAFLNDGESLIG